MDADSSENVQQAEQDFDLLTQANEEFNNANYSKCLEILQQLETSSGGNSKLRHNRAVAEFYISQCKNHEALLKSLNELDADELDKSKASSLVTCLSPIARYNKAVIYFHRHMHRTAIETLSPLVEKLDALEGSNAALVGLLMLRLLLVTNQLNKAHAFLELLQIQLGLSTDTLATDESPSSESLVMESTFSRTFKLLAMLTNVLNRKVVVVPEDVSTEFSALKAHQYYIMKDFQMAAKQLKKISAESHKEGAQADELNTLIANNMGVIHLRVRHYAIATKFFQNAITFDKQIASNMRNAPLQHMSKARSCEILYNLGISMLHLRRPQEAFQCLLVPLRSHHSNPRLWFRMAEACIMDHEKKLLEENKKPLVSSMATAGARTRYVVRPTPKKMYPPSGQSAAAPEPNLEFAALSLRNALTLTTFYRASFHKPLPEGVESENQRWSNVKDNNFCNPSKPISKAALDNMLSAIYAAYSYVSLRLGDYVRALEMAQELLKADQLSDAHKTLAHMYAGEALIMMDRLAEARPHLEPTFVSSLNAFDFETKDWQVKSLDAAQNVVRYNLAVAMVLQGDLEMAVSLISTCTHPIVASKITSLKMYMDIRAGNCN